MYPTGDSGYPLEPWMLTPVIGQQQTAAETAYNTAHAKTRNPIERTFGIMKSMFRCLDKTGGELQLFKYSECNNTIIVCKTKAVMQ